MTVTASDLVKLYGLTATARSSRSISTTFPSPFARTGWPSRLGLPIILRSDIERNFNFKTEQEKRVAFFSQWKGMKGSEATYRNLISALLGINKMEDAEGVCGLLLKSLQPVQKQTPVKDA